MNIGISLRSVCVEFDVLSVLEMNIKRSLVNSLTGRKSGSRTRIAALTDVNLTVESGERVLISGQNGAGKSTLLRVISGFLPPTRGQVRVSGRTLALLGGPNASLDHTATGYENIVQLGVQLGETSRTMRRLLPEIAEFSGLTDRLSTLVATYSSGMAARLRFSTITALRPQILIVDEGIASTADRDFSRKARNRLANLQSSVDILVWTSFGSSLDGIETRTLNLQSGRLFVE